MNDHHRNQHPPGGPAWRKSSYSGNNGGQCVEVALHAGSAPECLVRDSKDPAGPVLTFTLSQWRAFAARVKAGVFDLP
jgi:hypothetical protein